MAAYSGIRVTSSTAASPSPGYQHLSACYKYRGDPEWEPGSPRYREPEEPRSLSRGGNSVADKQARFARFRHLIEAEGKTPEEAGREIGIAPRTTGKYEQQRLKLVEQEAQGD